MASIDITIRGAGIFGLSIAWEALARGARVRVIDPKGPGAGASGGIVGALAPHTPDNWNAKKAFQLEALLAAPGFWAEVEEISGLPTGFRESGRLQPLMSERGVALARARRADALENWGDNATWEVVGAPADDWYPPSETGLYIHDTLSALIHPRQAVASLAKAVQVRGVEIIEDGPDVGTVIHATGWRGLVETGAGVGQKGQAALLRHDAGDVPQIFADGLHIIPHADGSVAVGSTSEREFDDPTATDAQCDVLVEEAQRLLPVLAGAPVIETWAGVRPRAQSRAPLLGPMPDRPGHFIANGGFKIGFGIAPMVAQVMADLVLEGRETIPSDFLP